ncbi:GDYXXLXY domain-containing protein [Pseudoflavitalea sp. G-6-1-2]|uniref:GDYXXLXY domain-containing protein n=1 Tax=Pseudoflavitalea sp. G-6-1-2 TaxID=2728841 RepID=UPI00146BC00E|nr:GDYXXLXY domain-containing protein [Pseudoflavitalea sp. G-6-1-2]NML24090.1 GDYXXLXY domain-containing protein [Pseudoflavitalea sp. G-6-1-2]
MKKYQLILIVVNLLIILAFFHYTMNRKEQTLSNGKLVLLPLAPVDPRSLMQGDYMDLRYAISTEMPDSFPVKGYYVVELDSGNIARKVRIQPNTTPLQPNEYLIGYRKESWRHSIGAESYFFQEGEAEKFEAAKFGGLRIDDKGNSVLVGLYDDHRNLIK